MALERLWGAAAQFRDIKALESIFDDEITYLQIDGRLMTEAEVLADTRAVSAVAIVVDSSVAHSRNWHPAFKGRGGGKALSAVRTLCRYLGAQV